MWKTFSCGNIFWNFHFLGGLSTRTDELFGFFLTFSGGKNDEILKLFWRRRRKISHEIVLFHLKYKENNQIHKYLLNFRVALASAINSVLL